MTHVQRNVQSQLLPVARDNRGSRIGPPADDGIGIMLADCGELGGHISILGAVNFISNHIHAYFRD